LSETKYAVIIDFNIQCYAISLVAMINIVARKLKKKSTLLA